jgi:Predicted transcriptional regulators
MHLVPPERAHRRIIDDHRVCEAIAGVGDSRDVRTWAARFAALSDPARLTLLLCIHAAGPICVSDLAVAADMNDTAVSQSLRLLRSEGIVTAHRDGRVSDTNSPTPPFTTCCTWYNQPRPPTQPTSTLSTNIRRELPS